MGKSIMMMLLSSSSIYGKVYDVFTGFTVARNKLVVALALVFFNYGGLIGDDTGNVPVSIQGSDYMIPMILTSILLNEVVDVVY